MKFQHKISKLTVVVVGSLIISVGMVHAQRGTTKASPKRVSDILRVKTFSGLGNKNEVRTPEYKTNVNRGRASAKTWYRIAVDYDTAPDWIDELTFQYYAMVLTVEKGVKSYVIFKTSVRYVDIESGNRHTSAAYLHSKALERYGDVVAVAVEILNKGKVIAERFAAKGVPEDWWKNPVVTESQSVTVKDGYLLSRADSPFSLVNIDDYEFAK